MCLCPDVVDVCSNPEISDEVLRSSEYRDENPDALVEATDVEKPPTPTPRIKKRKEQAGSPKNLGTRKRIQVKHYSPAQDVVHRNPTAIPSKRGRSWYDGESDGGGSSAKVKGKVKMPELMATKQLLAATSGLAHQLHVLSDRMGSLEQHTSVLSPTLEPPAAVMQPEASLQAVSSSNQSGSGGGSSVEDLILGVMSDQVHMQRVQDEADGYRRSLRAVQLRNLLRGMKK